MKADVSSYHVSIELGGMIYVCNDSIHSDHDLSWVEGKDVEARVVGNGKQAKGSVLSTSPAGI